MLERTSSSASTRFAVDDDAAVLEAAWVMALHGVLIDQDGSRAVADVRGAIRLSDLAGLPAAVAAITRQGRKRVGPKS